MPTTTARKPPARRPANGKTPRYNPANPLVFLASPREVNARMAQARAILKWCNAHPHGGTVQTAKGEIELLSTEVAERRAAALAIIETHGPEHIAFLRSSKGRTRIHATVPDSVADYLKREAARAGISKAACIRAIIANAAARNCLP